MIAISGLLTAPLVAGVFSDSMNSSMDVQATSTEERDEVFLSFRYRGVGDVVVIALYSYETGQIYLPTTELFERLGIYYQVDSQNLLVNGHYIEPDRSYAIHFQNRTVTLDGEEYQFSADEMIIDELDFYMHPDVFEEVFNMNFSVDMNTLVLRLETAEIMPVVDRLERRLRRQRTELGVHTRELYPREFERKRELLGGGFLDYSLTGNVSEQTNFYNYTASIGAEVLGGDIQGNLFGSWSEVSSNFSTSGLRWRYVFEDQPWLTQVRIGQHFTEGPQSRQFRGINLTNQPIEPRRTLDEFVFQGTAPPDSEVELFINNRLVDYQEVDELGNYLFNIPMTYGSSQIRMMIYEPDGQIRELDRRVQVPFTFLPPGEFNYHVSAGQIDQPLFGVTEHSNMVAGDFSYGAANWLTARVGGEYLEDVHDSRPFIYGGVSTRLFDQYLMNVDIAPDAFYRVSTNVVYANAMSWSAGYTHYTTDDGLYNFGRNDYEANAHIFVPFHLGALPVNFRISGDRQHYGTGHTNRVRGDFGVRLGRFTLRGGYRNNYRYTGDDLTSSDGRITGTATYTTPRTRSTPAIIRGTYMRAQLDYSMRLDQVERIDMQLSRSIYNRGRLRLSYGRNMVANFNIFEGALIFDFNRTRSTTTVRNSQNRSTLRQNIRGSIGYDDYHNRLVFESRQQVGRSAASVRLFVDRNDSGTFDEGDELITTNAIRLDRAGNTRLHSDGIIRVTQMQQYYNNNMEINLSSIPNPLLVPVVQEFSFVSDPNRFKPMDIPFYMSGVIEGAVKRQMGGELHGLGGARVLLRQVDGEYEETMRTFSDGSYYAMGIPPGHYESWVDTTQQVFLNARSEPPVRRFEVQALADGDFLEDLDFILYPRDEMEEEIREEEDLQDQFSEKSKSALRYFVLAQQAFYQRDFTTSLDMVNRSLELYETDYGLALKGSIQFVKGRREEARELWDMAIERNPLIVKPDIEQLEMMIRIERGDSIDSPNGEN